MTVTVKRLEHEYGAILRSPPLSDVTSPYLLRQALRARRPAVDVSHQSCRTWWNKYKQPAEQSVQSAQQLEDQYGGILRGLACEHNTAYKLCAALRSHDPPVYVSDSVAKQWLLKYFGAPRPIHSAGHLESLYGERLRVPASGKVCPGDADALSAFMRCEFNVSVPAKRRAQLKRRVVRRS